MDRLQRYASFSIVLGAAVLGLKTGAWWLTDSAALFSDALESTVNVAGSLIALVALRFAARPADANHPYGHQKAEFFAAVVEGAMIMAASVIILQHAWQSWRSPQPLTVAWQAIALSLLATVLNGAWGAVLQRIGRTARSEALMADGRHLWADVASSLAIVAGVLVVLWTGLAVLDPAIGALAGLYVLWSGLRVLSQSVGGLMDAAPAPDVVDRIRQMVSEHAEGALEVHDLRTRHAGRLTYLEFHLVVPGDLRVSEAHSICDRIEQALREDMAHLVITIHVEPEGKAKHHGVLVL